MRLSTRSNHAIGKLSTMPGQRSLVLVSPGFLVLADSVEWETRIVDRAIRAGVVVSAVDVKRRFEPPGPRHSQ